MFRARRPASVVLLAWLVLARPAAGAQQLPTFSVSVTEPDEVIEQVGTTRRIGRAELDAHQARSLDEALRLLPGIYVRTGADGTPRIDVRGFRSRHVLLLIDGVPFNSTADGQFDPARIPTEAIREIKVSYGSSSVLYGDNALAAVIEIITAPDASAAALDVGVGTPDQRSAGGRVARSFGRLDLLLSGTAFATDGFRLPGSFTPTPVENGGRRENSDRTRSDLRGNLAYAPAPSVRLATEWTIGVGEYGVTPGTINDPNDVFAQRVRYDRIEDYRHVSGQASVAFVPSPRLNVRAWGYRNVQREDAAGYDDATYTSMDDQLVSGTFRSRERTTVSGSALLGRIDLQRAGWLRVALNQRRESFASSGVIRDVPVGGNAGSGGAGGGGGRGGGAPTPVTYGVRPFAADRHDDVYSAGSEWQFHPVAKLGTVIGAAANWQDRVDAGADAEPSWIAGASYDATTATRLHASVTRKVRFPSIDQLYNEVAGNPSLVPERTDGFDAGVDQQLGRSSQLGVAVFSTRAANFIERDAGRPFSNRHRYRFSGAEVTVQARPIPAIDVRAAYDFLDAVDLDPSAGGALLQARPRHRATLDTAWRLTRASTARATVYSVADQRYDSRRTPTVQRRGDDYTVVDASLTQALWRQYEVIASVTNLFDTLYEQAYGFPREGRTALLRLRVRFD